MPQTLKEKAANSGPMKIGEAAQRVGIPVSALRRLVRKGEVAVRRIPGSGPYYFDPAVIEALAERVKFNTADC